MPAKKKVVAKKAEPVIEETPAPKKVGFQKGMTGNPKGRPVSKPVDSIREALADLIKADFKKIKSALKKTYDDNPKAYLQQLGTLMRYAAPQVTATQFTEVKEQPFDPKNLSNEELDQLLTLMDKANAKGDQTK
jgi:hypothetical protein